MDVSVGYDGLYSYEHIKFWTLNVADVFSCILTTPRGIRVLYAGLCIEVEQVS